MRNYKLTPKQQELFRSLNDALNACLDAGLYIWDNYGTLSAVNGHVITTVAPDESLGEPLDVDSVSSVDFIWLNSCSDDALFVKRK